MSPPHLYTAQQSCQGLDRQSGVPLHLYTDPNSPARAQTVSPVSRSTYTQIPTVLPGLRPSVRCPAPPIHRSQQSCQGSDRQSGVPLHLYTDPNSPARAQTVSPVSPPHLYTVQSAEFGVLFHLCRTDPKHTEFTPTRP